MDLHHLRTLSLQRLRRGIPRLAVRTLSHATHDPVGVQLVLAAHTLQHVPHTLLGMLGQ